VVAHRSQSADSPAKRQDNFFLHLAELRKSVAAAFYQYLEALRVRVKLVAGGGAKPAPSSIPPPAGSDSRTPLLAPAFAAVVGHWPARLAVAAMFGVNSGLGYLFMLAVMSFNGGVFVAVVVGLALGYLACSSGRTAGARRLERIRCANRSAPPVSRPCHGGRGLRRAGGVRGRRAGGRDRERGRSTVLS
jgi:hypothetical protein